MRSTTNQESNNAVKQWNLLNALPCFETLNEDEQREFALSTLEFIETIYGISAAPEKYINTIGIISYAMKNSFSFLNLGEVKDAFAMNALGKFENKIEHYGRIDMPFIAAVFNAYLPIRYERIMRYKEIDVRFANASAKMIEQKPDVLTNDIRKTFLIEARDTFKLDEFSIAIMPIGLLYDYAVHLKYIDANDYTKHIEKSKATLTGKSYKQKIGATTIGQAIAAEMILNDVEKKAELASNVVYEAKKYSLISLFETM